MKKLYTKFPLILLTLLNYAPYTHTTNDTLNANSLLTNITNAEIDIHTLVQEFINAEIPENFNLFFYNYFPSEVMSDKNKNEIYLLLSQLPLSPSLANATLPFVEKEFEQQIQANLELKENSIVEITCTDEKYTSAIPLSFFSALGCNKLFRVTINPERNILFIHFENEQITDLSFIGLINTKTLVSMLIPCAPENQIKAIGLNSDCSQLGAMHIDGSILSYNLPTDLVNFTPSLKQRAFISYLDTQINILGQKIMQSDNMIKAYSRLPLDVVYKLTLFIDAHKNLLPESLYNAVYKEKADTLQQILTVSGNARFVAETLNLDIDTLADKITSNEITQEQLLAILSPELLPTN